MVQRQPQHVIAHARCGPHGRIGDRHAQLHPARTAQPLVPFVILLHARVGHQKQHAVHAHGLFLGHRAISGLRFDPRHRQARGAEIVGDGPVQQLDQLDLVGVAVGLQRLAVSPQRRGAFGIEPRRGQPVGFGIIAALAVRGQGDRRKHQRKGGRGGNSLGHGQIGQVRAQRVKGFLREQERRVVRHVRRVDPRGRVPLGPQVAEGRLVQNAFVQEPRKGLPPVGPARQPLDQRHGVPHGGGHVFFGVFDQVLLAVDIQAPRPVQPVIGRRDRPA